MSYRLAADGSFSARLSALAARPACSLQVKDHLRRSTLETYRAAESIETFKRIMWRERRPRLLRVLAEECAELDRCDETEVARHRSSESLVSIRTPLVFFFETQRVDAPIACARYPVHSAPPPSGDQSCDEVPQLSGTNVHSRAPSKIVPPSGQ